MTPAKNPKETTAAAEAADLASEYAAPFAVQSHDEGARFKSLASRGFNPPRYLDLDHVPLGATAVLRGYCRTLGWDKFVHTRHDGYKDLMLEFYTTLDLIGDGEELRCRLMGQSVSVTRRSLRDIFGFPEGGLTAVPRDFDTVEFWEEITGQGGYDHKAKVGLIKDPNLRVLHSFISLAIFGKSASDWTSEKNLFYLWCARGKKSVCTPSFLLAAFKSVIARGSRSKLCLGNFITAIAVHSGLFDPDNTDMKPVPARALGLGMLKRVEFSVNDGQKKKKNPDASEPMVAGDLCNGGKKKSDASDPVYRQLKKMEKQMKDGLDAINARLNGMGNRLDEVESKVNSMAACYRTLESKWVDLGHGKSKRKNVEADECMDKLGMEKTCNGRPEVLLKRIKKVNEEVANTCEEEGIFESSKKGASETARFSGDIINIMDNSDDEATLHGGETADTSNRDLGSNVRENNLKSVQIPSCGQRTKRSRTECTDDLLLNSTAEKKGKTQTSQWENECLKSARENKIDFSLSMKREDEEEEEEEVWSGPPGFESQTPLRKLNGLKNDVIRADLKYETNFSAELKGDKLGRKFTYEAEMLRAFQGDDQFCMEAVCALYRKQMKLKGRSNISKNGGFSPVDFIRGCALAEYLIDGDKELRLRKSVSQVKKHRPEAIGVCRKLANFYVEKLLEVYRSGEDPLFGQ